MKRSLTVALVSLPWIAAAGASCGSNTAVSHGGTGGHGGGTSTTHTSSTGGAGGGQLFIDSGPSCNDGTACGDGGVCLDGACCATGVACGTQCCAAGDLCNFQKCEAPGVTCADSTDCAAGTYCDYALGPAASGDAGVPDAATAADAGACTGGAVQQTGKCLSLPPACAQNQMPGNPITCLPTCEYKPAAPDFSVVQKYSWGGQVTPPYSTDVMMAPIVINLDDDNCDGKVNENDIPEIVFSTFTGGAYFKQGTLHAISIVNGKVVDKWSKPNVVQPGGGLAAADLDGDGIPEIVGCMDPGPSGTACCDSIAENTGVVAFRADGSVFWTQPDTAQVHCGYETPVIGDLDQDGFPEVVVGWTILDGRTGAVKKNLDPAATYGVTMVGLSDLDGDGKLDVTDGQRAYRSDGTVIWDLRTGANAIPAGYHAIGDFDKDGVPEVAIVSTSGPHTLEIVHYDPTLPGNVKVLRKGIDINNGVKTAAYCGVATEYGGGPPTVADFDGDGIPDVGMAGAVAYSVFSGATLMNTAIADAMVKSLWSMPTHDCSSAVTGSSVFDFTGSGKAQVIYSDERHLWMYDGPTGTNLIPSTCNTTGTLWEYPLVADVENIGQSEIVVASNAYGVTCPDDGSKQAGIRVFGSASGSWVRTRRIWNEHTYHITNINENGTVPKVELPNWMQPGLNDYRQNKQPGSVFAAPDAVVSVAPQCPGSGYQLVATVQNLGEAPLPAGVLVGFYAGAPPSGTSLGKATTTKTLYPAEAQNVVLTLAAAPTAATVYAVVDDGMPAHPWHECRTDNDTSAVVSSKCSGVQ